MRVKRSPRLQRSSVVRGSSRARLHLETGLGPKPGLLIRRATFAFLVVTLAALSARLASRWRQPRHHNGAFKTRERLLGIFDPNDLLRGRSRALSRDEPTSQNVVGNSGNGTERIDDVDSAPPLFHLLPNVLLVGAQQAGTTSVANFLIDAGVCGAAVEAENPEFLGTEVQFFNDPVRYEYGLPFYADRFSHCPEGSLMIDATPNYLTLVRRIRAAYNEAGGGQAEQVKVVVILREPISRELSWYNNIVFQLRKKNPPDYAFMLAKDIDEKGGPNAHVISFGRYVTEQPMPLLVGATASYETPPCHQDRFSEFPSCFGLYAHFVEEWFDWFSREQVLVLSFDEVELEPKKVAWRLMKFLNLDEEAVKKAELSKRTEKHKTEVEKPGCQVTDRLSKIFDSKNEVLYRLLEERRGGYMEQRPFPRFSKPNCTIDY